MKRVKKKAEICPQKLHPLLLFLFVRIWADCKNLVDNIQLHQWTNFGLFA